MNEVLLRSEIKRVLSFGIPPMIAKQIVINAINLSVGKSHCYMRFTIDYSIDIIFGIGLTKKYTIKTDVDILENKSHDYGLNLVQ